MSQIHNFTTDGLATPRRLAGWAESSMVIGGVEAEPISTQPFHGTARVRSMGETLAWCTSTSPHRLAWTQRLIARALEPHVRFWFQRRGQMHVRMRDRQITISPGEWLLLDSRSPYIAEIDDATVVAFQFPLRRLVGPMDAAIPLPQQAYNSNYGVAQMVRQCLEVALQTKKQSVIDAEFDDDLAESLIDLARLALRERQDSADRFATRETGRERIRSIIRRNIKDPTLSVELIAKAAGCSARYVHKLFNTDETIGCYIRKLRLERCRAELVDTRTIERTITEIAFDNGFNSSSHFSRAFRLQYGVSPREYRRLAER